MPKINRNEFVDGLWKLRKIEDISVCASFDCTNDDLNDYFRVDALKHEKELLTQTYCLQLTGFEELALALLDCCNDAVRLERYRSVANINPSKRYPFLPAVKLTRFGVDKHFQRQNIGTHTLNMLKKFFITDNRTGCRFITVDAYNKPGVLNFYKKNGFALFTDKDKNKQTRAMFFDLKRLEKSV